MATQVCDRTITYRNFDFARAEAIVQEEEYLDDEDFDDIRFYRRHGNILEGIEKSKEKYDNVSSNDFFATFSKEQHRQKREVNLSNNLNLDWIFSKMIELFSERFPEVTCYEIVDLEPVRKKRAATYRTNWTCVLGYLIKILAMACAANNCLTPPQLDNIDDPRVPQCPGGRNCPRTPSILALVPFGLVPVAEFPPFRNPFRTVNAEAVIFREEEGTLPNQQARTSEYLDWKAFGFFATFKPSEVAKIHSNIICISSKNTHFLKSLEGVAKKLSLPCPFQF